MARSYVIKSSVFCNLVDFNHKYFDETLNETMQYLRIALGPFISELKKFDGLSILFHIFHTICKRYERIMYILVYIPHITLFRLFTQLPQLGLRQHPPPTQKCHLEINKYIKMGI